MMNSLRILLAFWVFLFATQQLSAQTEPLKHGHAHNDYVHARPLFEALENGFTSIEIDVFLHNDKLVVSHIGVGLNGKKTIEELYLNPISKIVAQNGGTVYKSYSTPVIFMIDFKTESNATYQKLQEVLGKYQNLFTVYKGHSVMRQGAVNILISGGAPIGLLLEQDSALATADGSVGNMDDTTSARVITRYSTAWKHFFGWNGKGQIPQIQQKRLKELVEQAHKNGKQIRFYHIPDKPNCWRVLLNAGVDWINTDRLPAFRKYFQTEYRR